MANEPDEPETGTSPCWAGALADDAAQGSLSGICLPSVPSFAPGEVLARRFVVERLLARGGMGEVFLALDRASGERVALKSVLPTHADDARAVGRLRREFALASRIRHPNVCHVHELAVHDEEARDVVHFMTMEWLPGQSLRTSRRWCARPLAQVARIAQQVLRALAAVHSASVLHLDVKSDNVVLCSTGVGIRSVLIDFGLARSLAAPYAGSARVSGSLGYMAPEQLRGEALSPRTDIFSLGVVLYELLTGKLPFERRSLERARHAILSEPIPPGQLRRGLPRPLEDVVLRCLKSEPRERFADALSALDALERAAELAALRISGQRQDAACRPQSGRR